MRILQLCHHLPFPPRDGGKIAMYNMALALKNAGHEVHQFSLNPTRNFVSPNDVPDRVRNDFHLKVVPINTSLTITGALSAMLRGKSYNVIRFFNPKVEKELIETLTSHQFDIIQFETIFCTPYLDTIRRYSDAKIVLRAHNIEHTIWHRLAKAAANPLKAVYLSLLSKQLKKYEINLLSRLDGIVPITSVDEDFFRKQGFKGKLMSSPLGIDLSSYSFQPFSPANMSLFHLGSMDWMPNVEGVEWFLKECWPLIHSRFPQLKLFLAGKKFPDSIRRLTLPNVVCIGAVEKASEFMSDKQLMIVPLRSGSGLRVKIIEGLAYGKTIISTTIGAEGIEIIDGKTILLADRPEDFLNAIEKVLSNPELAGAIGEAGRKLAEEKYSLTSVGNQMTQFYHNLQSI